jgi:C4-dicarboxylate-specific signal transduction histidine kinase
MDAKQHSQLEPHEQVAELAAQLAAISEVLRVIANSPDELQPICDAIVANAVRLCGAQLGGLGFFESNAYRIVSLKGPPEPYYAGWEKGHLFPILPNGPFARIVETKAPVHIADVRTDEAYLAGNLDTVTWAQRGARTYLLMPLLRGNDELIGAMAILRDRVLPFTERQIDLAKAFAAEAIVAFESTRRERRYREVQTELAHANRLSTIGQISASVTHEVNQPIAALRNRLSAALNFLDRTPPDLEEVRMAVAGALKDTDRTTAIVNRMRALMLKATTPTDNMDINDAAHEVIELTRGEALKNRVSLQTEFTRGLPKIVGDRVQLQQVVLNLIVNALQAISGVSDDARQVLVTTKKAQPNAVYLGVQDTGPGVDEQILPHLFEPFYTSKPDGMGMGLAICRSIIEAHHGRLWATGCKPRGALFQFTIPTP